MPTHSEKRKVPHTRRQMFDLVADIEKYPEFLPWCLSLRINDKEGDDIIADMVIGYKMFREKFRSKVELIGENQINVTYEDGPFKFLKNTWLFHEEEDGSCVIDFFIEFEFKSKFLENMIGAVFTDAVKIMVQAFEKRAALIYK